MNDTATTDVDTRSLHEARPIGEEGESREGAGGRISIQTLAASRKSGPNTQSQTLQHWNTEDDWLLATNIVASKLPANFGPVDS